MVGIRFRMFGCVFADKFPRASLYIFGFVGLVW